MADAEDMVKAEEEARAIEMWKIKKLIKSLEAARLPPPSPRVPLGPLGHTFHPSFLAAPLRRQRRTGHQGTRRRCRPANI